MESNDLISKLSEIRSEYNCFDEDEEPYYRTLSEAIKILSQHVDEDTISRQAALNALCTPYGILYPIRTIEELPSAHPEPCKDDKGCSSCMYSGRPTYKSPCSECRDNSQWERKVSR